MTELSRLSARVSLLQTALDQQQEGSLSRSTLEASAHELSSSLLPVAQKLFSKTKERDPVTQEPRYGKQHVAKISALLENTQALLVLYSQAAERAPLEEEIDELQQQQCGQRVSQAPPSPQAATHILSLAGTVPIAPLSLLPDPVAATAAAAAKAMASPTPEELKLHELAETARALKVQQKAELVLMLNQLQQQHPVFEQLYVTLDTKPRAFLLQMLEAICTHPDDEKRRRLRIHHPQLIEKFTHSPQSLSLLFALGFDFTIETEEILTLGSPTPVPASLQNDRVYLLASALNIHVFFCLFEPPPTESAAWLSWFDRLSACKDFAKQHATS